MDTHPNTNSTRDKLAFAAPGFFAALYVIAIAEEPISVDALVGGVGAGLAVFVAAYFGYSIAYGIAGRLLGIRAEDALAGMSDRGAIAAMLLAVAVWAWGLQQRDRAVDEVARCLEDHKNELAVLGPREVTASCYGSVLDRGEMSDWSERM
jgi:hypothetical protein